MIRLLPLMCLLLFLTAGCGPGSAGPEVTGKVTFADGKPLTEGSITFIPDAEQGNKSKHNANGVIGADGSFTLVSEGAAKGGVAKGWYRIRIVSTKLDPKDEYAEPIWLIPKRFGDHHTSGLSAEVVDSPAADTYHFKLTE